jgi:hypothetical protein
LVLALSKEQSIRVAHEVYTVVKIEIVVFWVMRRQNLTDGSTFWRNLLPLYLGFNIPPEMVVTIYKPIS